MNRIVLCRKIGDYFFGLFGVVFFVRKIMSQSAFEGPLAPSYGHSFFFINYQAGFIRRGLLGELNLLFSGWTGFDPEMIVYVVCCVAFASFVYYFFRQFEKQGLLWWGLPGTFCLGAFPIIRADEIIILTIVSIFWIFNTVESPLYRSLFVWILGIIAVLIHEASFFFFVPLLFVCEWKRRGFLHSVWLALPMVIVFFAACLCHGTPEQVHRIIASWGASLPMNMDPFGEMTSLSKTAKEGVSIALDQVWLKCCYGIPGYIYRPIQVFIVFLLASQVPFLFAGETRLSDLVRLRSILVFQLVVMLPMFFIFADGSRITGFWVLSSYAFFLLGTPHSSERNDFSMIMGTIWKKRLPTVLVVMLLLLVGIRLYTYNIGSDFRNSPIGTFITVVRFPFGDWTLIDWADEVP